MIAEQILADLKVWKEFGASPKMPVHIVHLEKVCRDAIAYQNAPDLLKDAIKQARAE